MSNLRKLMRVMMTLVMAVVLGGVLPFSAAEVAASTGYGSIEGYVYEGATANPLYPATIIVENYDTGELIGEFSNYADGSFYVVVPDGTCRVGAQAPGHITAWYPNNCRKQDATPVTVPVDGTVSNVDFNLELSGSISGTVWNQWMNTEQNQIVIAWTADNLELVAWAFSNEYEGHGQYGLPGSNCGYSQNRGARHDTGNSTGTTIPGSSRTRRNGTRNL